VSAQLDGRAAFQRPAPDPGLSRKKELGMKGTRQFLTAAGWTIGLIAAAILLFFAGDHDDQYSDRQPYQQHSR
jgi:hypothetical protein